MRSSRMRGYGSWCMGWKDAPRTGPDNNNNPSGCLIIFFIVLAFCFFKAAIEVGSGWGFIFGLALLAGFFGAFKK